ncbi:MAG: hypothetical protein H0V82_11195 [Candidatus Protochlamydia sp.]|nr:hypothetical protein [Candidatus Protochlamydia sp.]
MLILIIFIFLAGIVTVLSPFTIKALSVIPETLREEKEAPHGILIGWVCSFAFFSSLYFALIRGFGFSPDLFRFSALLFMGFFGLVFILPTFTLLFAKMILFFKNWKSVHSGFLSGVIFGALLGLVWTPVASLLIVSSAVLAAKNIFPHAIILAFIYALGAGLALFDLVRKEGLLITFAPFGTLLRQGLGFLMIGTALLLVFGAKGIYQNNILKDLPNIQIQNQAWVEDQLKPLEPAKQPFINQDFDPFARLAPVSNSELQVTPEIFLGYNGANAYVPGLQLIPETPTIYDSIDSVGLNQVGLKGEWEALSDHVVSYSNEAVMKVNYKGSLVYMVLGGESSLPLQMMLDGSPISQEIDMNERAGLFIKEKRLYQILNIPGGEKHELAVTIPKGIKAYAFIFASE